jgi:hypothetical protein
MSQALKLPSLATTPLIPFRPGILPMRVVPRLVPRLYSYATRVRVHMSEGKRTWPDGTEVTYPAADLVPKLITNTVTPENVFFECYALMRDGDPEGFLLLSVGKHVPEGNIGAEFLRATGNRVDIYLDEKLLVTMEDVLVTGETQPFKGYYNFLIPTQTQ